MKRKQLRDQSCQPLDLSRAEPAVMLLRLSFSSFWSGIKRWLKCSSGFGRYWYTDGNYCVNGGMKHVIETVQGKTQMNLKHTKKSKKFLIMHFALCVFVSKLRHFRISLRTAVTGRAENLRCEGLPLCGVRPMMSEVKRAAAEEAKGFYLHRHWTGHRYSLKTPSRNKRLFDPHYN